MSSAVMVGRAADLDTMRQSLQGCLGGTPRGVILGGEAGIGKSRLLAEFLDELDPEIAVARGQCTELGLAGVPFTPIKGVLRDLVAAFGADAVLAAAGPGSAALTALAPRLNTPAQTGSAPQAADPALEMNSEPAEASAELLFEAIGDVLEGLSQQRPIVVAIEDVHWADAATLQVLHSLVRLLRVAAVLVVITYRTDDVGRGHPLRPVLAEIDRGRHTVRVELGRLPAEQVAEQVAMIAGDRVDPLLLGQLVERSEGVPFFVEELLGLGNDIDSTLPDTLRDLVLARYERLSKPTQAVLRMIAAGGVSIDHEILAEVFDGDPEELDTAADEAIAAHVLVTSGSDYAFRHALTREAVHDVLLPGEYVRHHARYAEVLSAHSDSAIHAAEISHHWLAAHDIPRAFTSALTAAETARRSYAHASAAQMGERALTLWPNVPDAARVAGRRHVELLHEVANSHSFADHGERAMALMDQALQECPPEEPSLRARLLHDKAAHAIGLGHDGTTELMNMALNLLSEAEDQEDRTMRARILGGVAVARLNAARFDEALAIAREATEEARIAGSQYEQARAATFAAGAQVFSGDIAGGLAAFDEVRRFEGEEAQQRHAYHRSSLLVWMGQFREGADLAAEATRRAGEPGRDQSWAPVIAPAVIEGFLALGEWDSATAHLAPLLRSRSVQSAWAHPIALWLHLWRDETEEAARAYDRTMRTPTADGDPEIRTQRSRALAEYLLAQGEPGQAWAQVRELRTQAMPWLPGPAFELLAVAARVLAAEIRAGIAYEDDAEAWLRRSLEEVSVWPVAELWRALIGAELSGPEGTGTDVSAWQGAAEALGASAPAALHGYSRYRLAEAQIGAGDLAAATDSARAAITAAARIGAAWTVRLTTELGARARLGLDPAAKRPGGGGSTELTPRERQVLDLVAAGLSNKQIGAELFISTKTASVHVSAILRKLGVASRTEAAVAATRPST